MEHITLTSNLTPTNMEGSLYVDATDNSQLSLHDEISASGHKVGISETSTAEKSPFLIMHGREIIGEIAIREYLFTDSE